MAEFYDGYDSFAERLRGSAVGVRLHEDEDPVRLDPELQLARPLVVTTEVRRANHWSRLSGGIVHLENLVIDAVEPQDAGVLPAQP